MSEKLGGSENGIARRRAELGAGVYVILFLFLASIGPPVYLAYSPKLARSVHWSNVERWMTVLFVAELILVMLLYRLGPLKMTFHDMGLRVTDSKWNQLLWGFLAGVLACGISVPVVLKFDRYNNLAGVIIDDFYHSGILWIVFLYGILLPVTSEIVFRGILFKSFLESSSTWPAVLLISFSYAFLWPCYTPLAGFVLGIFTALLYHRFRTVYPAIVANAVMTIGLAITLVCSRLYRFPHILTFSR